MSVGCVILAAGTGTRMKSATPKIFQEIAGKPIIRYVIDACRSAGLQEMILVIPPNLEGHGLFVNTKTVVQTSPLGTANAVLEAIPFLKTEYTIITCGDIPLIARQHLQLLLENRADVSLIAMRISAEFNHMPYGRVITNSDEFQKIVEYKNATVEEKKCGIANSGVYTIKTKLLTKYLLD
ncbi:MAG: NTP transferase domain-containing protein, partial [Holosporales bacterium]|nr:NTP transferase domain-containing protein [Holosporales bacterium]